MFSILAFWEGVEDIFKRFVAPHMIASKTFFGHKKELSACHGYEISGGKEDEMGIV